MDKQVKFFDGAEFDPSEAGDPIESMIDEHVGLTDEQPLDADEIKRTTAFIDRIEEVEDGEDKAVLYIGEDTETMIKLVVPISLLPKDAIEGDDLVITIAIDKLPLAASGEEE